MVASQPALTPESFADFMGELNADPARKADVIRGITERGFLEVLEENFHLSKGQQEQLEPLRSGRGGAAYWEQMFVLALSSGGNLSIVHEGRRSVDISLHAEIPFVGTIDVEIHC